MGIDLTVALDVAAFAAAARAEFSPSDPLASGLLVVAVVVDRLTELACWFVVSAVYRDVLDSKLLSFTAILSKLFVSLLTAG